MFELSTVLLSERHFKLKIIFDILHSMLVSETLDLS